MDGLNKGRRPGPSVCPENETILAKSPRTCKRRQAGKDGPAYLFSIETSSTSKHKVALGGMDWPKPWAP